jgi:glycosyltransferase involved in cell wall biosynthesis
MVVHEQTGLIVRPNDPDELARAIKTLALNAALRNMMGKKAYQMAMSEWNWDSIARKHLDVYTKVIDTYHG